VVSEAFAILSRQLVLARPRSPFACVRGMVDALVANLAAAACFIEKEGITNLRLAENTGYAYRLGFGVQRLDSAKWIDSN
jgi:hypothetical protein